MRLQFQKMVNKRIHHRPIMYRNIYLEIFLNRDKYPTQPKTTVSEVTPPISNKRMYERVKQSAFNFAFC